MRSRRATTAAPTPTPAFATVLRPVSVIVYGCVGVEEDPDVNVDVVEVERKGVAVDDTSPRSLRVEISVLSLSSRTHLHSTRHCLRSFEPARCQLHTKSTQPLVL